MTLAEQIDQDLAGGADMRFSACLRLKPLLRDSQTSQDDVCATPANGTYVNSPGSLRISKIALRNGDRVFIGRKGAAILTYCAD